MVGFANGRREQIYSALTSSQEFFYVLDNIMIYVLHRLPYREMFSFIVCNFLEK